MRNITSGVFINSLQKTWDTNEIYNNVMKREVLKLQ